jgi:predicted dehydrogenase
MLALEAGKNVLCEKALTVTAAQTKKLYEVAKSKNLFFMEAVWTRYFPLSIKIRELIQSGAIGTVYRTFGTKKACRSYTIKLTPSCSRPLIQQEHR